MKQNSSSRRVNEQARQVIAEILMFDISDPRLAMVTITGCEVSFDRSVANVYYTTEPGTYEQTQDALERAAGKIRTEMAKKLSWRTAPELRFHLDKSVDEAERIAYALQADRDRNYDSAAAEDASATDASATDAYENEDGLGTEE